MRLAFILCLGFAGLPAQGGISVIEQPCADAPGCLVAFAYEGGYPPLPRQLPRVLDGDVLRMVTTDRSGAAPSVVDMALLDGHILSMTDISSNGPRATWAVVSPDGATVLFGGTGEAGQEAATYGRDGADLAKATGPAAIALSAYAFTNAFAFDPDGTLQLTLRGEDAAALPPLRLAAGGEVAGGVGPGFMEHIEGVLAGNTEAWFQPGLTAVTGYNVDGQPSFVEIRPEDGPALRLAEEPDLQGRHEYLRPMLSPDGSRLAVTYADTADTARTQLIVFSTESPGAVWSAVTGDKASYVWAPDGRLVVISDGGARITLYRP